MEKFNPDWASPPWETIKDIIAEKGMPESVYVKLLGLTDSGLEELKSGDMPIEPVFARQLSEILGSSQQFWLNREIQYRAHKNRLLESQLAKLMAIDPEQAEIFRESHAALWLAYCNTKAERNELREMLQRWQDWNDKPIKDLTLEYDSRSLLEHIEGAGSSTGEHAEFLEMTSPEYMQRFTAYLMKFGGLNEEQARKKYVELGPAYTPGDTGNPEQDADYLISEQAELEPDNRGESA